MNSFRIVRDHGEPDRPTLGQIYIAELDLQTLELPWKDNASRISCIPVGSYRVTLAWSNRFQRIMPRLLGVPGRDGILIHSGNTPANTEGCILVGLQRTTFGTLAQSRAAFDLLFHALGVMARDGDMFVNVAYAEAG